MERPPGRLFVGEQIDNESGDRTGESILLDSADFTTHGVIVGMTGSGKTGLGMVLIEEALVAGIPVLAIDPKGDLGNLCLTFPDLAASDFEPWMDSGAARVQQKSVAELAESTAELWRNGLASWGLDGNDVGELAAAATPVVYTPGSTSGIPLDVLGRLSVPTATDPGVRQDEIDSTISGLLGLIGVDSDPLSGREHILLANLIARSWDAGADLDLPTLLGQVLDPPIRKLGVLDLDTFFPAADRQALVLKLNGLLASPSFARWAEGAPLDIDRMLWTDEGKPRAAVLSLGHLEETERHFAITLVLGKLISWMRSQSGTGELRVLVYIDEVMGLAPPVGNPATKKPILTLLKQARAFGVGLVLSTQNPVDLDYKAISNAGTWLIGRLQTEQDKQRLVDGLRSADGSTDLNAVEAMIGALGKRQFVLRTAKSPDLSLFSTRWAMSYLAGPMTGAQLNTVMASERAALSVGKPSAAVTQQHAPSAAGDSTAATLADDESTIAPKTPDLLQIRYAVSAAPWLGDVGATAGADRLLPFLAARVQLLFDETKAKLRETDEWEAIIPIGDEGIDLNQMVTVDFDDRDFSPTPPDDAVYVLPAVDIKAGAVRSARSELKTKLYSDLTLTLHHNPMLKLWSRPGESIEDFMMRCEAAADDGADAAALKIRNRIETKRGALETALAKADDRVHELQVRVEGRKQQQLVDIGASLLGSLLGGRSRARQMASAARRVTSGQRQKSAGTARLESAQKRAAEKIEAIEELELDLAEALIEIDDEWSTKAADVSAIEIPLEKSDITIEEFSLVWLPVERS